MKKLGMVLGAAALAAIAGCRDPNYKRDGAPTSQNDVKNADTTVAAQPAVKETAPRQCTCAPGTRHAKPCECGGANCFCIVEQKVAEPVKVVEPAAKPVPVEPETTVYVVQSGDYLAKISKKFNVTISSIKRVNNMTGDVIRVGQKLKIPGKVDVGVAPAAKAASPAQAKKAPAYAPYTGATKEYVVKSGDSLGAIAYGNGINIRQLKELNGLKSDVLRVGQKIKVPAEKQVKASVAKKADPKSAAAPAAKPAVAEPAAAPAAAAEPAAAESAAAPASAPESAPAAAPAAAEPAAAAPAAAPATATYVVQEGDDMTGVSIRWGVSAADIRELNNLGDSDQLTPGQIIKLPAEAQQ